MDKDAKFVKVGPPNVACYHEMCKGPPLPLSTHNNDTPAEELPNNIDGLWQFFHSKEFLELLEKITELPFCSSKELRATSSLRKYSQGSYSLLRCGGAKQTGDSENKEDSAILKSNENKKHKEVNSDEEEEEEVEDPNLVDISYFFASKWNEGWGGLTIYNTDDGEQLITIPPEGNCLAIVVRNSSVNSYVNYINCNADEELFFVYTMTCALDGNL